MSLARMLNACSDEQARADLGRCCGARGWVQAMLGCRPFTDDDDVIAQAQRAWWSLGREDWLEAFAHHPRIGQVDGRAAEATGTRAWATEEQAGALKAPEQERARFVDANRRYEERFGHVFLICATGRTAAEMYAALEQRMENDPDRELEIAAGEQAKITRLRLLRLAGS